jgi:exonuclease III
MEKGYEIWQMYRSGSFTTVVMELARYKLDLVGVQEVRWDKAETVRAGDYTLVCRKGNENQLLGTGFFIHQRIVLAGKTVEFISDRMSCIVLRGHWCNIVVLNEHALTEEKSSGSKDSFYEELEQVFNHFPKYQMKILLADCNVKSGREDTF